MFGNFVSTLNENKYFYAMAMILFNIGARYIEIDLDEEKAWVEIEEEYKVNPLVTNLIQQRIDKGLL